MTEGTGTLRIGRFHVHCLLALDHPAPEIARSRVSEVVERIVPATLASIATRTFPEQNESLWFIRELELAVDLNVSLDAHELGRSFAASTTRALLEEMSAADGKNTVRFDSPAQYLAAFLADLAEGRAWQHWYYRKFDGLKLLSVSAALRTVVCDNPENGLAAVQYLNPQVVVRIINRLTDNDARRILDALTSDETPWALDFGIELLECVLDCAGRLSAGVTGLEKAVLIVLFEGARSEVGRKNPAPWLCEALVVFTRTLAGSGPEFRDELLKAIGNKDSDRLSQLLDPSRVDAIVPLVALPDPSRLRILEAFGGSAAILSSKDIETVTAQTTSLGGIFFLLPLLDCLPFDLDREEILSGLRWLILAKCFGKQRAIAVARDPLIREIAGVPSDESIEDIVEHWLALVNVSQLWRLVERLYAHRKANDLTGQDDPILAPADEDTFIRIDPTRGHWISIHSAAATAPAGAEGWLQQSRKGEFPPLSHKPDGDSENLFDAGTTNPSSRPGPAINSKSNVNVDRLSEDLDYFSLPEEFGVRVSFDLALTVLSQGLMRDFAWRLPGFSWSGPAYLNENFLRCDAVIERQAERCVVTLGPAPLNLILSVAGINRQRFELSWWKGSRFELYPRHS